MPPHDAPARAFPNYEYPRDFVWTKGELRADGYVYGVRRPDGDYDYELRYNPAPDVILWVEEMDRNYILRLEREGKLLATEPHADTEIVATHAFRGEIISAMQRARLAADPLAEAERKAETERKAKAEAERKVKQEEAERKAKAEAERKAREEETRKAEQERLEQQRLLAKQQAEAEITQQAERNLKEIADETDKADLFDIEVTQQKLKETEAKLLDVQSKLAGVGFFGRSSLESEHAELMQVAKQYRDKQYDKHQRDYIEAKQPLFEYFMTVRIQLCCTFTAAQAIHSTLVADGRQGPAARVQKGTQQVVKLADFIPIIGPMIKTAAGYIIEGLGWVGDTIDKKILTDDINRLVGTDGLASNPVEMTKLSEHVARLLTFAQEQQLMLMQLPKASGVVATAKSFKAWAEANQHDSPAKQKAADDVKKIVEQVMKKGLKRGSKEQQLIEMIVGQQAIVIPSNIPDPHKKKQPGGGGGGAGPDHPLDDKSAAGQAAQIDPMQAAMVAMEARLKAEFAAQMEAQREEIERLKKQDQARDQQVRQLTEMFQQIQDLNAQHQALKGHLTTVAEQLSELARSTQASVKPEQLQKLQKEFTVLQAHGHQLLENQKKHAAQLSQLKPLISPDDARGKLGLSGDDRVQLTALDLREHNEKAVAIKLGFLQLETQVGALTEELLALKEDRRQGMQMGRR